MAHTSGRIHAKAAAYVVHIFYPASLEVGFSVTYMLGLKRRTASGLMRGRGLPDTDHQCVVD